MTEWTQLKGDPQRTGLRRDLEGPYRVSRRWTSDLSGPVGSPALDRDTVFVGTRDGNCYAFDRDTGRRRWTVETTTPTDAAPAVTREAAFFVVGERVLALDPGTGDQLWETTLPAGSGTAPALADGHLYVGHADGVSALEAATGEVRWTHETDAPVAGSPAVDGDGDRDPTPADARELDEDEPLDLLTLEDARMDADDESPAGRGVYVGTADETVLALAAADGEERWRAPTNGTVVAGPTVADDRVYVADDGGTLVALHADSGQSWFTYSIQDAFTTAPTVASDAKATFVGAADGYLHVTDTTFGRRKRRGLLFSKKGVALDGPVRSSPVVVGDVCCVADATGSVYGVDVSNDGEDCDLRWHEALAGGVSGTPAVADHRLYVGDDEGTLVCLEWDGDGPGR